jgi:hypothetical protein
MHFRSTATPAALALALTLAACTDTPTTAPITAPRDAATTVALHGDRLATIEAEGRRPALYIQNADGTGRVRVRFANVHDKIAGNWPAELLPVVDERILALGPAKWSPDGQQLAVVVTLGFDQSQVVVMNADGRNIRTASPNGQIILGDIDWAPDSRAIAYGMSTLPHAQGVDLFVTDLVKDAVQRITHEGRLSIFDEYRFDASGRGLWHTQFEGWSEDGRNRVSRVYHASLSGQVDGVPEKLVGNAQGVSRDGRTALVLRYAKEGWDAMELVRVPLARGGQEELLAEGELWYAELLERDDEAVLVGTPRSSGQFGYHLLGIGARGDARGEVPVTRGASSMAFLRATR